MHTCIHTYMKMHVGIHACEHVHEYVSVSICVPARHTRQRREVPRTRARPLASRTRGQQGPRTVREKHSRTMYIYIHAYMHTYIYANACRHTRMRTCARIRMCPSPYACMRGTCDSDAKCNLGWPALPPNPRRAPARANNFPRGGEGEVTSNKGSRHENSREFDLGPSPKPKTI